MILLGILPGSWQDFGYRTLHVQWESHWDHLGILARFLGVSNGLIQFKGARKIWPLLELLAKIR